jgi:hypothetical protein
VRVRVRVLVLVLVLVLVRARARAPVPVPVPERAQASERELPRISGPQVRARRPRSDHPLPRHRPRATAPRGPHSNEHSLSREQGNVAHAARVRRAWLHSQAKQASGFLQELRLSTALGPPCGAYSSSACSSVRNRVLARAPVTPRERGDENKDLHESSLTHWSRSITDMVWTHTSVENYPLNT